MADLVYVLCALTCAVCAGLLLRAYGRHRTPILLWSSLCFVGLLINNILLIVDFRFVPTMDLSIWRSAAALAGMGLMVFGLVWESE